MIKFFSKNKILPVIVLAAFFGLAGGAVGFLLSRAYFFGDIYNIPYLGLGEINLSDSGYQNANLIIREPKKVVVEQEKRIQEAIKGSQGSMVGIFAKKNIRQNKNNLDNFYILSNPLGQGLVITSDGWIISGYFFGGDFKNYVLIDKDKNIYEIDKIIPDSLTKFYFIHVKGAKDLPVKRFLDLSEIVGGQQVFARNWNNDIFVSRISKLSSGNRKGVVKSSEKDFSLINLSNSLPPYFNNGFLYDLNGYVVGLVNSRSEILPISFFSSVIQGLLRSGKAARAKLGVNYINLDELAGNITENQNGALIYPNDSGIAVEKSSPADLAGLKSGDIVTYIDNFKVDGSKSLADILAQYLPGNKINLRYLRNNVGEEVTVELIELKK